MEIQRSWYMSNAVGQLPSLWLHQRKAAVYNDEIALAKMGMEPIGRDQRRLWLKR